MGPPGGPYGAYQAPRSHREASPTAAHHAADEGEESGEQGGATEDERGGSEAWMEAAGLGWDPLHLSGQNDSLLTDTFSMQRSGR